VANTDRMLNVDEALARVLDGFAPLDPVKVELQQALGLVLAEDVVAPHDVPYKDNSALDGYALRASDVQDATIGSPAKLTVIADLAAGRTAELFVRGGEAVRIMTGATIPEGADAVIGFEDTDRLDWGKLGNDPKSAKGDNSIVGITESIQAGNAIRRAGEDIRQNDVPIASGAMVTPGGIGVLASIGYTKLSVHPRPVVSIVPTGDEIIEIDEPMSSGKVRNSHAWALEALVRSVGAIPYRTSIVSDDIQDVRDALFEASENSDLILTIGGVSMGDYDLVKTVIGEDQLDFWQVLMKPGKPLVMGRINDVPILGLPGNPVSGLVVFELFGRPAIMKMMGYTDLQRICVKATATVAIPGGDGRRMFARVLVDQLDGEFVCKPTGDQGSGIMSSMAAANGLAIVPEDIQGFAVGETVLVLLLT